MTDMTPDATELRPVSDYQNELVNGDALVGKRLFDRHVAEVKMLRERQEAYEQSLPTDPAEAMSAICGAINGLTDEGGKGYAARAALTILQELTMKGCLDDGNEVRYALMWLANEGLKGLSAIEASTSLVQDIARGFHPMHEPFRA